MKLFKIYQRTLIQLFLLYIFIAICITEMLGLFSQDVTHQDIVLVIWAGLAVLFVMSAAIVYSVFQRLFHPLRDLAESASQVALPDLQKNPPKTNDETSYLSLIMNSLVKANADTAERLEKEAYTFSAELRDTLSYYRAIVENLSDGLLVTSPKGHVTQTNPALKQMYGYVGVALRNKEAKLLFPPDLTSLMQLAMTEPRSALTSEVALAQGKIGHAAVVSIHPDARKDSEILCVAAIIRDITPDKEIDRMKNDFISTVSHELKTPLTSVQGFVKIVKKKLMTSLFPQLDGGNLTNSKNMQQVLNNLDVVLSEAGRLTELVNDVLDISKMESGRMDWHMQPSDLRSLINQAVSSVKGLIDQKSLTLFVELQEDLPQISVDRHRLVQVLINLLSNAVKFTNKGSISVSAWQNESSVKITVDDTGEGIDPQYHNKIFERFSQVTQELTDKPTGTGLGLAICKDIIEAHNGSITLESERGKGSSFQVILPLPETPDTVVSKKDLPNPKPSAPEVPVILIADKEKTSLENLRRSFISKGYHVLTATTGFQALEMTRMLLPDLIVLDVNLPGLSGSHVLNDLKNDFSTRDIPVIAVSGSPIEQLDSIDATFTKPFEEKTLFDTVRNILLGGMTRDGSSISLSANGVSRLENMLLLSPQHPYGIPMDKLWDYFDRGFSGTVLVPASMSKHMDINRIVQQPGVQIIILPG